ncbi:unnamed protein product [Sphagnum jensenii]
MHLEELPCTVLTVVVTANNYKHKYPDVIVLDPPEAIQQLQSRQSMLEGVAQLDLCDCGVAKPLVADGTAKSHAVSLSYDK